MHAQAGSYRDRQNALLTNAKLRGEYLGGYRVRVGDDGRCLSLGDADSDEKRGVALLLLKMIVTSLLFSRRHLLLSCFLPFFLLSVVAEK